MHSMPSDPANLRQCHVFAALRAQPVVEMDGDQFFKSVRVQPVQQRDGVASAGDGDELRIAGGNASGMASVESGSVARRTASAEGKSGRFRRKCPTR